MSILLRLDMIISRKSVKMTIKAISTIQPQQKRSNHTALNVLAGAGAGALSRYVIPAKSEVKEGFFSSAQMNARSANRSILKYAGVGAAVAFGLNCLKNVISSNKNDSRNYNYESFLDSNDCAYEITWLA